MENSQRKLSAKTGVQVQTSSNQPARLTPAEYRRLNEMLGSSHAIGATGKIELRALLDKLHNRDHE